MSTTSDREYLTSLLNTMDASDSQSVNALLPLVYNELRQLARRELRKERVGHTLNTTALVHEAYLKLVNSPPTQEWSGRRHFFFIAARAMRQVLVNYARARKSAKRGEGKEPELLQEGFFITHEKADDLIGLDEALNKLEKLNDRQSRVVECRYFGGYSVDETAEILGISSTTVKRDWTSARAWLYSHLRG